MLKFTFLKQTFCAVSLNMSCFELPFFNNSTVAFGDLPKIIVMFFTSTTGSLYTPRSLFSLEKDTYIPYL